MTADLKNLRFFVDENILGVGKSLAIARDDAIHTGHPLIPEVPVGTLDTDWIPAVAARNLVVISRDKAIRTKPAEIALLRAHDLRIFWIARKKDRGTWGNLVLLVRRWEEIESIVANRGPGPWFMAMGESRISEFAVQ